MLPTRTWKQRINCALAQRYKKLVYRERQPISNGNNRWLMFKGKRYLNFSSNDYLGLAHHPQVITAWQQVAEKEGVGAGSSGHMVGYSLIHERLEQQLANWLGFQRALLFHSGFIANQAVVTTMTSAGDQILADHLSHTSLLEAAIQSQAEFRSFLHNDHNTLQRLLQRSCIGNRLVITEGVFSMDGDQAPLSLLKIYTHAANGWLMVDDAHGIGVLGKEGKGSTWVQECHPDILVITFGKAIGVSGAAVLCQELVAEYLIQFSRHIIYSTALPPAQIAAIDAAVTIIRELEGEERRKKLRQNIAYFRNGVQTLGYKLTSSSTAIQPLLIGDNQLTLTLATKLRKCGLWLMAIRPPTVSPGSARLRITLTSSHQYSDIDQLLESLSNIEQ